MRFYFFLVFTQLVVYAVSWASEKCFVYEEYVDVGMDGPCPKSNLSGYCKDVSNVALDLAGIPSHLQVLCLKLMDGSKLHPYSFSRFQKLRHLRIDVGDESTIFPGAFKKLESLQKLEIQCNHHLNFSLSSDVLSDIQNITRLSFIKCKLSSMAIDVFKGMMKLETIYLYTDIDHFSDLLCRLVFVSSLKYLIVDIRALTILRQPNCTFSNGTSFDVEVFYGIEWVTLLLAEVTVIDKTDLEELYWVYSDIEYIEDFTFNNTGLLKYLDFSNNKISTLTEYSFFGLPNLKTLLLNENKLVVVDALTFMHLTSLESLSLGVFQYPSSEPSEIQINFTDSLYRSRYTLCLISRNYLRSNWCSLEMRLATYRLQVEHKDILILVFLEKIPHHLLNAHHRLARLVKTWTYIDWPQDPALHNAFWDRLWAKLAPETAT